MGSGALRASEARVARGLLGAECGAPAVDGEAPAVEGGAPAVGGGAPAAEGGTPGAGERAELCIHMNIICNINISANINIWT